MYKEITNELLQFIKESPTQFHAVEAMAGRLLDAGYVELKEKDEWKVVPGMKAFVTRNHSSLIAFSVPEVVPYCFRIMASHSDSPMLRIKEKPEMSCENAYVKLNVEKYGGMLLATWFDRPLSAAGRVVAEVDGELKEILVDVDRDILMVPSLAIHMNRQVNESSSWNAQKDMLPLFTMNQDKDSFMKLIAEAAGVAEEQILDHELYVYNRVPGTIWGLEEEFVSAQRLDDLQCAFSSLTGFLKGEKKNAICVHAVMDNEEVGSGSKQGAASTFLRDVLMRINGGLGRSYEDYLRSLAASFMVSGDNAHAVHPNYADKADPVNRPYLNRGIVIKYNGNQKYCTDAWSGAMFKKICKEAEVPYQTFFNRSDIVGGSTLGNISNTQVALDTVDIGLPQLAMHSSYETAGVKDTYYLCKAAEVLFS